MVFLEALAADGDVFGDAAGGAMLGSGLVALIMGMLLFFLIFAILLYVYMSFAFMAIAKKAKYPKPGIAWIPFGIGPAIIASNSADMHWWPILLMIGSVVPVVGGLFSLAFAIFFIIWMWKTFEAIGKPGWWAILLIIPVVNLIMLGIAAWSKK